MGGIDQFDQHLVPAGRRVDDEPGGRFLGNGKVGRGAANLLCALGEGAQDPA